MALTAKQRKAKKNLFEAVKRQSLQEDYGTKTGVETRAEGQKKLSGSVEYKVNLTALRKKLGSTGRSGSATAQSIEEEQIQGPQEQTLQSIDILQSKPNPFGLQPKEKNVFGLGVIKPEEKKGFYGNLNTRETFIRDYAKNNFETNLQAQYQQFQENPEKLGTPIASSIQGGTIYQYQPSEDELKRFSELAAKNADRGFRDLPVKEKLKLAGGSAIAGTTRFALEGEKLFTSLVLSGYTATTTRGSKFTSPFETATAIQKKRLGKSYDEIEALPGGGLTTAFEIIPAVGYLGKAGTDFGVGLYRASKSGIPGAKYTFVTETLKGFSPYQYEESLGKFGTLKYKVRQFQAEEFNQARRISNKDKDFFVGGEIKIGDTLYTKGKIATKEGRIKDINVNQRTKVSGNRARTITEIRNEIARVGVDKELGFVVEKGNALQIFTGSSKGINIPVAKSGKLQLSIGKAKAKRQLYIEQFKTPTSKDTFIERASSGRKFDEQAFASLTSFGQYGELKAYQNIGTKLTQGKKTRKFRTRTTQYKFGIEYPTPTNENIRISSGRKGRRSKVEQDLGQITTQQLDLVINKYNQPKIRSVVNAQKVEGTKLNLLGVNRQSESIYYGQGTYERTEGQFFIKPSDTPKTFLGNLIKPLSNQKEKDRLRTGIIPILQRKPGTKPRDKVFTDVAFVPIQSQPTAQITGQPSSPRQVQYSFGFPPPPTRTPPTDFFIPPSSFFFPPVGPLPFFGTGRSKVKKFKKQGFRYAPSFTALGLNLASAKLPKRIFGGFEPGRIRYIPLETKKRKRKKR